MEGNLDEVRYTTVGGVIVTLAGPEAVVVAIFKNNQKGLYQIERNVRNKKKIFCSLIRANCNFYYQLNYVLCFSEEV